MTDEERKEDPQNSDDSTPQASDVLDEVEAYAKAAHRFSATVDALDWPDHMNLKENTELSVRLFRDFWRQHQRRLLERERRQTDEEGAFVSVTEKNVRDYFKRRFHRRWGFGEDDEPLNIDPKEHTPDEDHQDEASKERQRRFQDEWE